MTKVAFLAGAAVGYVLGTKAGRRRYEQLKGGAAHLWASDPVQSGVASVRETIKEQAPAVTSRISEVAMSVGASARERLTGEQLPNTVHRGTDGRLHADTTGFGPGPGKLP
jgi:hypothetical protein